MTLRGAHLLLLRADQYLQLHVAFGIVQINVRVHPACATCIVSCELIKASKGDGCLLLTCLTPSARAREQCVKHCTSLPCDTADAASRGVARSRAPEAGKEEGVDETGPPGRRGARAGCYIDYARGGCPDEEAGTDTDEDRFGTILPLSEQGCAWERSRDRRTRLSVLPR